MEEKGRGEDGGMEGGSEYEYEEGKSLIFSLALPLSRVETDLLSKEEN